MSAPSTAQASATASRATCPPRVSVSALMPSSTDPATQPVTGPVREPVTDSGMQVPAAARRGPAGRFWERRRPTSWVVRGVLVASAAALLWLLPRTRAGGTTYATVAL